MKNDLVMFLMMIALTVSLYSLTSCKTPDIPIPVPTPVPTPTPTPTPVVTDTNAPTWVSVAGGTVQWADLTQSATITASTFDASGWAVTFSYANASQWGQAGAASGSICMTWIPPGKTERVAYYWESGAPQASYKYVSLRGNFTRGTAAQPNPLSLIRPNPGDPVGLFKVNGSKQFRSAIVWDTWPEGITDPSMLHRVLKFFHLVK